MSVPETIVVIVPREAAALAVGADKVAAALGEFGDAVLVAFAPDDQGGNGDAADRGQ